MNAPAGHGMRVQRGSVAGSPLLRLVRVFGGTMLMHGRVSHRVLGQLLISRASSLEVLGANLVVSAAADQPNRFADIAIRTIVPLLAMDHMADQQARRLVRLEHAAQDALARLEQGREQQRRTAEQLAALRSAQARLARRLRLVRARRAVRPDRHRLRS